MRTASGCLGVLLAVLAAGVARAREADAPPPRVPGLVYLGLNAQGAEEWHRVLDGATVIRVPGGSYLQREYESTGTSLPPKPVDVPACYLDKHEVTNAQFARFLVAMGKTLRGPAYEERLARWLAASPRDLVRTTDAAAPWRARAGRERHPVTDATGWGALGFAYWVGAEMPTRAQWEKAAGGPDGRVYPWGSEAPDAARANFGRPRPRGTLPVGALPAGAGPYGHLDMAGNAYERVMRAGPDGEVRPVMLKGGAWLTPHPLNLRVLDLCMQPMHAADGSVGFRCAMRDPQPDRPTRTDGGATHLRVRADFSEAVEEAQERGVPIFLSLQYDTCGQCDRVRAQVFADPRFIAYCNEHLVVLVGHQSGDALTDGHQPGEDDRCPFYPDLECWEHHRIFKRGLAIVGSFEVSPGNFVLNPDRMRDGAGAEAMLVAEDALPKWGGGVEAYLAAFERARKALRAERARAADGEKR
jgi:formylglycine-generating enzyme required for sulfatase activity